MYGPPTSASSVPPFSRATTRAVVLSICYIIVVDMIFSFFLNR